MQAPMMGSQMQPSLQSQLLEQRGNQLLEKDPYDSFENFDKKASKPKSKMASLHSLFGGAMNTFSRKAAAPAERE